MRIILCSQGDIVGPQWVAVGNAQNYLAKSRPGSNAAIQELEQQQPGAPMNMTLELYSFGVF